MKEEQPASAGSAISMARDRAAAPFAALEWMKFMVDCSFVWYFKGLRS